RTRRRILRAEQTLEAVAASGEVARLLDLPDGTPVIRARRIYFTAKDRPVYYLDVRYHPSHYDFNVDLVLREGGADIGFIPGPGG
ncbi:UTRA domain-containing protein, partial [Pseudooceanicola nanhaiensis]